MNPAPLHPLLIHYPIALLPLAWLADLLATLFRRDGLRTTGLFLFIVGTLGAGGAWWTGRVRAAEGAEMLEFTGQLEQVVARHQTLATVSSISAGVLLLWRIGRHGKMAGKELTVYLIAALILSGLVVTTAYFGGWITHGAPLLEELGVLSPAAQ